jgi:hypothetical protein
MNLYILLHDGKIYDGRGNPQTQINSMVRVLELTRISQHCFWAFKSLAGNSVFFQNVLKKPGSEIPSCRYAKVTNAKIIFYILCLANVSNYKCIIIIDRLIMSFELISPPNPVDVESCFYDFNFFLFR